MIVWLVTLVFLFLFHNYYWKRRPKLTKELPPGPAPLPLLGNLPLLMKNPPGDSVQLEWKQKYGPLYTIWMGRQPLVCVADYQTMVETFQKDGDAYAGRANENEYMEVVRGGVWGVIFTEGATLA
ncbi:hypothetical protein M3Y99_01787000 [Aphelenchoides fujianensis]|nr:hypothetical protein M3Y99_01787000 [Aphelenchoides fujianensis]